MPTNRRVLMHASRLVAWAAILPLIAGHGADASAGSTVSLNWSNIRVLLYTKNGTGYVHDNIPASIEAIKDLAREHKFAVDASADPAIFRDETLAQYNALIFSNTNNVVFDTDAQRVALMRYVQAGGGFAAIHSASGSERTWKWFAGLLGGTFSRHAPIQKFAVRILDRTHPSVAHLPERWERDDECYYLVRMNMNLRVLAANELTTIQDPKETPATFGDCSRRCGTRSSTADGNGTPRSATARRTTRSRSSAAICWAGSSRSFGTRRAITLAPTPSTPLTNREGGRLT